MALPMNVTPTYTLEIPSTKKKVKYRPFLVKDEKALLIAQQSNDLNVIVDTIKELINSCVKDNIDVNKLASFDLEYIFLQLRSVSVGEMTDVLLACDECNDEKAVVKVSLNLNDIKVIIPKEHTTKIKLFNGVGVVMKYPSLDVVKKLDELNESDVEHVFNIIVGCIDSIYDSDEVYPASEQREEDLMEFLNNLTSDQFEKIQQFFTSMPKLSKEVKYRCPVCDKEHNKVIEGLQSFF